MHLHAPDIADGELPVHMNPGSGSPFGMLFLGTGWHTAEIVIHDDEDADRLIRALATLKAMRAMLGTPHPFTPSAEKYGPAAGHCHLCGMLADASDHAAPCTSMAPHSLRQCTLTGEHVKHRNGPITWGPGVTEPEPPAVVAGEVVAQPRVSLRIGGNSVPLEVTP